jgi:hypothetical protein
MLIITRVFRSWRRTGLGLASHAKQLEHLKGLDMKHSDNIKTDFTEWWCEIHLVQDRQTNGIAWTRRESSVSWQSVAYPDYMNDYQLLKLLSCMRLVSSDSSLVEDYELHIHGSNPRKGVVFLLFTMMAPAYTLSNLLGYGRSQRPKSRSVKLSINLNPALYCRNRTPWWVPVCHEKVFVTPCYVMFL